MCVYAHARKRDLHVRNDIGPHLLSGQGHCTNHTATCTAPPFFADAVSNGHTSPPLTPGRWLYPAPLSPTRSVSTVTLRLNIPLPPSRYYYDYFIVTHYYICIHRRIVNVSQTIVCNVFHRKYSVYSFLGFAA